MPLNCSTLALQSAPPALTTASGPIHRSVTLEKLFATPQTNKTTLWYSIDLFAEANDLIFQVANALAGLELRETLLQQGANALPERWIPEIEHRVIANGERGLDRVQLARGDVEGLAEGKPRRVRHDDVPEGVHATAPRSASHLLELVWNQHATATAIPFAHAANDDGARRHVDAQSKGVSGEDDLHQAASEEHLDELLQDREQPSMVEPNPLAGEGHHGLDLLQFPVLRAHSRQNGLDRLVDETHLAFGD